MGTSFSLLKIAIKFGRWADYRHTRLRWKKLLLIFWGEHKSFIRSLHNTPAALLGFQYRLVSGGNLWAGLQSLWSLAKSPFALRHSEALQECLLRLRGALRWRGSGPEKGVVPSLFLPQPSWGCERYSPPLTLVASQRVVTPWLHGGRGSGLNHLHHQRERIVWGVGTFYTSYILRITGIKRKWHQRSSWQFEEITWIWASISSLVRRMDVSQVVSRSLHSKLQFQESNKIEVRLQSLGWCERKGLMAKISFRLQIL